MLRLVLCFLFVFPLLAFSQESMDNEDTGGRYFEDQFYTGVTYNFILEQPELVNQRNFSYGLQLGFIKDIPLNDRSTVGLGVGLGLALNTYYTNIRAQKNESDISYSVLTDVTFKRSKLETHLIELPIQFRWRDSDATTYNFWRIYTGVKFGYAFDARSKYVLDKYKQSFKNTDVNKLQYGLTLNVGYHNFNVHLYYSLSTLYNDDVMLDSTQQIKIRPLQLGFIFYML